MISNQKTSSLQKGTVIIIMLLLILIISTITLSFFYLQILEVDLIAYETDYLHAFYFAQAALAQGENLLATGKMTQYNKKIDVEFNLDEQWENINLKEKNIDTNMYSDNPKKFCIKGSATVDNVTRTLAKDYQFTSSLPELQEDTYKALSALYECLENPPVVFIHVPEGQERDAIFNTDIQANPNGVTALGFEKNPISIAGVNQYMNSDQYNCFLSFKKDEIVDLMNQSMNIEDLSNYNILNKSPSEYLTMTSKEIPSPTQPYTTDKVIYFEKRMMKDINGDGKRETLINAADFTIKPGKEYILKKGLYFFQNLTLGKSSILKTDGEVVIYCSQCVVGEKAQMNGDFNSLSDKLSKNLVLMMAQSSYNTTTIEIHITLGMDAEIYGHVIIPNGKIIMSNGSTFIKNTLIKGVVYCDTFSVSEQNLKSRKIFFDNSLPSGTSVVKVIPGSWREE